MRYFVILFIGLLSFSSLAAIDVDLFHAEVILDKSDKEAEKNAKLTGFQRVIIKASGDRASIDNPVIKKALPHSSRYLSQISYSELLDQTALKMRFSPAQVQGLLAQASVSYWASPRTNILVWLVESTPYGRDILWEQSGKDLVKQVKLLADQRGLPMTIPVGDMDDVTSISAPDLWGGFVEPISAASQRYGTDAVLVVQINQSSNSSDVSWALYDEKPEFMLDSSLVPHTGNASGETLQALEDMIDQVSHYYATKSALKSEALAATSLTARFVNVTDANSIFVLERGLEKLNSVASLQLQQVNGHEVVFQIHLISSVSDFENEVIRDRRIVKFSTLYPERVIPALGEDTINVQDPLTAVAETAPTDREAVNVTPTDVQGERSEPVSESDITVGESDALEADQEQNTTDVAEMRHELVFEWLPEI
jgi:hypothetical protein